MFIGAIIDDIQKAGYTITAAQQFYVNPINSEEFLEIYKGVLPEYSVGFYLFYTFFLYKIISVKIISSLFQYLVYRRW